MIGLRVQVGRTYLRVRFATRAPYWDWEYMTVITDPKMYGGGMWIERKP